MSISAPQITEKDQTPRLINIKLALLKIFVKGIYIYPITGHEEQGIAEALEIIDEPKPSMEVATAIHFY